MSKLHPQTGPVTVEGKQISSRNATTHGGTSEKLIVAGEKQEDFDSLLNALVEEHSPATEQACHLVEDVALARWFLWRRQRAHNSVETAIYTAQPAPELWSDEAHRKLALMDRYQTSAERSLQRALRNLVQHQRESRLAEKQEVQAELAIVKADEALEQHDRAQYKEACQGYDRPTLVQKINVRITSYGAETLMNPTNSELLHQLSRPVRYPAEQVCRKFHFPQGMPREYYSFTGNEEYRREKGHTIEQTLTVSKFHELTAAERALGNGHALPNPEGRFVS